MICPTCNAPEIVVLDSRPIANQTIRRRRKCEKCEGRFTTYETIFEGEPPPSEWTNWQLVEELRSRLAKAKPEMEAVESEVADV